MKSKSKVTEDTLKKVERELLLKESSFQKEKALLDQRAEHFEKLCEEYLTKEKANENMLQSTHTGFNSQMKEIQAKYERTIKELETKLGNMKETNFELNEKISAQNQNFSHEMETLQTRERTLLRQIDELQSEVSQYKKNLSEASSNGLRNLGDLKE